MPQSSKPETNQESVWDYPRPPRLEKTKNRIRVIFNGAVVAETTDAYRVLETASPPTYYIPPEDVDFQYLTEAGYRTICEWKGRATHWDLRVGERTSEKAAWSYPDPTPDFAAIKGYLAFYPGRVDAAFVDDEEVEAQPGDFYGGWITSAIVGPFKGLPGTENW
ncbi:MAG: DUF427 domain-containing protein [Chloroflexi bacterium]|nr:MAG: DUF427 domain-containing protein [Chloroflexota bacterium]